MDKLYHYTNINGFLGVKNSKSLWLTHINYQNDSQEYYHALELIKKTVETEYHGLDPKIFNLNPNKIYPVYTYSLTTKKDLLSQWRGYCPNGGLSYCISRKQLNRSCGRYHLKLRKCVYDMKEKLEFIKKTIIGITPEEYHSGKSTLNSDHDMFPKRVTQIKRNILNNAPYLKHESFEEEQEWRIATENIFPDILGWFEDPVPTVRPEGIKPQFRERNNILTPYIEICLQNEDTEEVYFDNIVLSPVQDKLLSKSAFKLLFNDNNDVEIENSKIPYKL